MTSDAPGNAKLENRTRFIHTGESPDRAVDVDVDAVAGNVRLRAVRCCAELLRLHLQHRHTGDRIDLLSGPSGSWSHSR